MITKNNFLTKPECDTLISMAQAKMVAAKTCGENIKGYRIADNTWIYEENDITQKIKQNIMEETQLPVINQESIHIVSYKVGGEYKKHYDYFDPNTSYYEAQIKKGGNRVFTALIYLNDNFQGGETEFVNLNLQIKPEMGKLIIWRNMNEDKTLNKDSFHAGLPVTEGEKWIAVIWVRENEFKNK